jgi:CHAD domain-containing protein
VSLDSLLVTSLRETVERELKLSAGESFELPELGGEAIEPRVFVSTYHDTVDHRLARSGVTLRHRVEHGKGVWQLKLPHGAARLELEQESGPENLPTELERLLPALTRRQELVPVARLRTRREGVRAQGAEVVHDSVAVLDAQRVARTFDELEVELLEGDERTLRRLEKALRRAGAGDGETRPKLFQALDLEYRREPDEPAKDGSAGQVLAAAFRVQYGRLLAHDPGARLGADPEDVHQLRVATRRLRAYLRAGRPLVDRQWADSLREELAWLGSSLGPVRDLDVVLEHLRAEAVTLGDEDAKRFERALARLDGEHAQARADLVEALESDRYLALLDSVEAAGDPPLADDEDVELRDIWRSEHARLRKAVGRLGDDPTDDELHAARIKAKRARYAAELAGLDRYVQAAKRFQDVFGEHQDAVVAEERLRALARGKPSAALAIGRLIERGRRRRERARAEWPRAWRRLAKRAGSA